MMRKAAILAIVSAIVAVSPAMAATRFIVNLDSAQEVGTVNDPVGATGQGTLTLNDLGGGNFSWDYEVTISPELNFSDVSGMPALDNGGRQATGFHIHNEARGVNGGVIYGILGPDHDNDNDVTIMLNPDNSTTFIGSWGPQDGNPMGNINTHAPNLLVPAVPGDDVPFYFNVHTAPINPGGEIRGQIVAVPEPASALFCLLGIGALGMRRRRM